jgi:hypothetical protein
MLHCLTNFNSGGKPIKNEPTYFGCQNINERSVRVVDRENGGSQLALNHLGYLHHFFI